MLCLGLLITAAVAPTRWRFCVGAPTDWLLTRRDICALASASVIGAASEVHAAVSAPGLAGTQPMQPKATTRAFMDVRIIQRFDVEVLEDAAVRGRMVFDLYGDAAPRGTDRFADFIKGSVGQFKGSVDGPAYRSSSFERLRPGVLVEGGRITGLDLTPFAGQLEYQYRSRLLQLRPVMEVNDIRHTRRGLLTRRILNSGPEFGVTLAAAPSLDGSWEVIGELQEGDELLALIEGLPFISGKSLEEPGSLADQVFQAQKSLFTSLSKGVGDPRAADRTGQLLRRVEITNCGLL